MTDDAARLAEIEEILSRHTPIAWSDSAMAEVVAIARRLQADKCPDKNAHSERHATWIAYEQMRERAERAEARIKDLDAECQTAAEKAMAWFNRMAEMETERDAARAERDESIAGEREMVLAHREATQGWMEARAEADEAKREADGYVALCDQWGVEADKWRKEADALRAKLQHFRNALAKHHFGRTDLEQGSWGCSICRMGWPEEAALAGAAKAEEARREGTPADRPAPAAEKPASNATVCLECQGTMNEPRKPGECWDWDKHDEPDTAPQECPVCKFLEDAKGETVPRFVELHGVLKAMHLSPACPSRRG